jgi:hydroxymethylbilane synthase
MSGQLRLATRASRLALVQARLVALSIKRHHPSVRISLVAMTSQGDEDHSTPLYRLGSIGVFCKEVQQAVLEGRADAGVHSCKDLPTSEPAGLQVAAILAREDPRDALIGAASIADLPPAALIGTSSLRRQVQLAQARPDLRFTSIRGNVETRLGKVASGEVAATIMAMAGLRRLGLARRAKAIALDPWTTCTPAPGQGAIAVDCREDDQRTLTLLRCLGHRDTTLAVTLERAVLAGLSGGCSLPLGCFAHRTPGGWMIRARLGHRGRIIEAAELGLMDGMAQRILATLAP